MPAPALLPIGLALASAAFYGGADFAGGLAARRSSGLAAATVAQATGLVVTAAVVALLPFPAPTRSVLAWGAASGVFGGLGLACFFAALAAGRMATVAPIAAVLGAALPVAVGLLRGERPSAAALVGIALAVVAITLVSSEDGDDHARTPASALRLAVLSGLLFGGFFTALALAGETAGLWPMLANRLVSVPLLVALLLWGPAARRTGLREPRMRVMAAGSGTLDIAASWCFLAASSRGLLAIVAPLGALYPAGTVLLAVLVLREPLGRRQQLGLALAVAALVLIAS